MKTALQAFLLVAIQNALLTTVPSLFALKTRRRTDR